MQAKVHRPRRGLPAAGFTLIELLVVISIISLLIAILLPALANARMAANGTRCLANERQIALASAAYAGDFKDFPMQPNCSDFGWGWRAGLINGGYISTRPASYQRGTSSPSIVNECAAMVCPQLRSDRVIYGPTDATDYSGIYLFGWWRGNATTKQITTFNLGYRNNKTGPYAIYEIKKTANTLMVADAVVIYIHPVLSPHAYANWGYDGYTSSLSGKDNDHTFGNQQTWSNVTGLTSGIGAGNQRLGMLTHREGSNILFWDGHAEFYRYNKSGTWPYVPNKMLTANFSGNTENYP